MSHLCHHQPQTAALTPLARRAQLPFCCVILFPHFFTQGLYYEAIGKPERAKELYDYTLQDQPHNDIIPKRLVRFSTCVVKALV